MPGSVVKHDPLVRWSECRAHRNKLISCLLVSIAFHLKMGFLKQLITMIQSLDKRQYQGSLSKTPLLLWNTAELNDTVKCTSKMILMNLDESFSMIIFHQTCHACFLSELALTDSWMINSFDVIAKRSEIVHDLVWFIQTVHSRSEYLQQFLTVK